jgi:hypothetical protein
MHCYTASESVLFTVMLGPERARSLADSRGLWGICSAMWNQLMRRAKELEWPETAGVGRESLYKALLADRVHVSTR